VADYDSLVDRLVAKEPDWEPGTRHRYHAWSLGWYESELLHADDERTVSKHETRDQAPFEFLGPSSLLPEFPLLIEDGVMSFATTASQADFEDFGD
jgi:hypothetical protein